VQVAPLPSKPASPLAPPLHFAPHVRQQGPSQMKPVPTGLSAVPLLPLSLGLAGAIPFVVTAPPLPSLLPLPVRFQQSPYLAPTLDSLPASSALHCIHHRSVNVPVHYKPLYTTSCCTTSSCSAVQVAVQYSSPGAVREALFRVYVLCCGPSRP